MNRVMPYLNKLVHSFRGAVLIFSLAFILPYSLSGCIPHKPNTTPDEDNEAREMALGVRELNSEITSSKGMGHLILTLPQAKEKYKLAWAAKVPNKLRLTLLASGHPVETVAASGDWVSIISHTGRHKPHSAVATDPDLTPYIDVPVRLSEFVSILLGRIPLRPFDRAWFVPGKYHTIRTHAHFSSHYQEIQFSPIGRVLSLTLMDKEEIPVYRLEYKGYERIEDALIPKKLVLTGPTGKQLDISLYNFTPHAPVKESVFRLTESGS
jgi:hypothetical protein